MTLARNRNEPDRAKRRARHQSGHVAELLAAAFLMTKGYRILARRFQSPAGEVDLVVRRGRRLTFVEVKARPTLEACEAAITAQQRQRMRHAADYWLARHPAHRECDITFDAVFLAARRWPRHIPDCI